MATTSNHSDVRTLFDSRRNLESGLRYCADSKAIISSTQLSAKGNVVAVAFTNGKILFWNLVRLYTSISVFTM